MNFGLYRRILIVCILLSVIGMTALMALAGEEPQELIAVVPRAFPPQYQLIDGEPAGFAIDVMNAIAEQSNFEIKYSVVDDWPKAFEKLHSKQAHIIPNVGVTKLREQSLLFSSPLETLNVVVFVRSTSNSVNSLDDLQGKLIGVVKHNVGVVLLSNNPNLKTKQFTANVAALFELLSGQIDALVYPDTTLLRLARMAGVSERIKIIGEPLAEIKRAVGVRKDLPEVSAKINEAVMEFSHTDKFRQIYVKWYGDPKPFWSAQRVAGVSAALLFFLSGGFMGWRYFSVRSLNRELIREVEGHRLTTRALRKSERNYRELMEFAIDGIVVLDEQNNIVLANEAWLKMLGYKGESVLGHKIDEFMKGDGEFERQVVSLPNMTSGGGHGECAFKHKSGAIIHARVSATNLPDEESEEGRAALVFVEDISREVREREEKAKLQDHLRHAQKMEAIGTLAGGIAHDFNNVLQGIEISIALAEQESPEGSTIHKRLQTALKFSDRGRDLVRQVLAYSRRQIRKDEPVDLAALLRETLKFLRAVLPSNIMLREKLSSEPLVVTGDGSELQQVIINLCTNAAHAMEERGNLLEVELGRIELDAHQAAGINLSSGHYVLLKVKDNGVGIPTDVQERLYEPYFTTKPVGKGSGMGLPVAEAVVQKHGGRIMFESELNKGTIFYIYLPLSLEKTADHEFQSDQVEYRVFSNKNIMLVDDEVELLELQKLALESAGYKVSVFSDPRLAYAQFEKSPGIFDMVITDEAMPGLRGTELIHKIRGIDKTIPILIVTGYPGRIDDNLSATGANALIYKPVSRRDLLNEMAKHLDKK